MDRWKILLVLFIITRLSTVFVLGAEWNDTSVLCYAVDCKQHYMNVKYIVDGLNPYAMWRERGGYDLKLIEDMAAHPPLVYMLLPIFAFLWKSPWMMYAVYFLFDLLVLVLIYKLAPHRNLSSLIYILAPSIIRGIIFTEEELIGVAFLLMSLYFFDRKNYSLSTVSLALSFNIKFFPIVLLPLLLWRMDESKVKHIGIFILTTAFCHMFFFPDWYMFYEYRLFGWTLGQPTDWAFWKFVPTSYYPVILGASFLLFYAYYCLSDMDLKTGYLLGSILFIITYTKFSADHYVFLIPLFLVWTRWLVEDWIVLIAVTGTAMLDIISLPTIGLFPRIFAKDFLFVAMSMLMVRVFFGGDEDEND